MPEGQVTDATLHMMVDIETLGSGYDAAIVQVGIVVFDPFDATRDSFPGVRWNVGLHSAMAHGAVDASTILWWLEQSEEARRNVFFGDGHNLGFVLERLEAFWQRYACTALWANGATFDPVILATAYRKLNKNLPWSHRDVRDMRTLMWMTPVAAKRAYDRWDQTQPQSVRHDALDDARRQVAVVQECLHELGLMRKDTTDYTSRS